MVIPRFVVLQKNGLVVKGVEHLLCSSILLFWDGPVAVAIVVYFKSLPLFKVNNLNQKHVTNCKIYYFIYYKSQ